MPSALPEPAKPGVYRTRAQELAKYNAANPPLYKRPAGPLTEEEAATTPSPSLSATAGPLPGTENLSLFTTARYTYTPQPITPDSIPCWTKHVARLRKGFAHFARDDWSWGVYAGDAEIWDAVKMAIAPLRPGSEGNDWRVRITLSRPKWGDHMAQLKVETPRMKLPPFVESVRDIESMPRRALWVDTRPTPTPPEDRFEADFRRFKTNRRKVYELAQARFAHREPNPEVLLWCEGEDGGEALEGTTSNFAVFAEDGSWITPRNNKILPGIMRATLLEKGDIKEVPYISVNQVKKAEKIVCFNALRGVWIADLKT